MKRVIKPSAIAAVLVALAPLSMAQVSSFDTDADGWNVVTYVSTAYNTTPTSFGAPNWVSTGGNPGGYVQSQDPDNGDTFFQAPAKFLGNHSAAYGQSLSYDLMDVTGNNYNSAAAVILKGGGLVANFASAELPTTTSWTHFVIPLTEAGWTLDQYQGTPVSQAQFQTILGNLTSVEIRPEYEVGPEDMRLDSVVFPAPEPSTLLGLGLGFAALARRRKK